MIIVYYKLFEVEKFRRFRKSIAKRKTFTVKHFHLVLKMAGHGPGSTLKEFTFCLGEGLWSNAAFPELLIHSSNAPDKINIAIQLFTNDV